MSMMRMPLLILVILFAACRATPVPERSDANARQPATADTTRQMVQQMIGGHIPSMLVSVAAKLRIADHLRDGPRSVADLAKATRTHEDSLYRLLRALTELGLVYESLRRPEAG